MAGHGDTLVYADIGLYSTKRSTNRSGVTSDFQDEHHVVYSTVNLALQQPVKTSTHHITGPCPEG